MRSPSSSHPQDWREGRRLRAWELHQQGWSGRAIAAALGVTPGAVSQWLTRAKQGGSEALHHHPPPGPSPKLTTPQLKRLPGLLARGAEAFGFRGEVWTTARVATVITREFGVHYHPAHLSRLLRAIGWSLQQPIQRAAQRDEAAIAHWYRVRWPALKKGRRPKAGPSSG
jgi:transposase